jgi:hypothetical protein
LKRTLLISLSCWLATGCGEPPPGAPVAAPDGGVTVEANGDGLDDLPPATCRWQGYGIGFGERGQCAAPHLLSHALVECQATGGAAADSRQIAGHCPEQAEEVQISCCFRGPVPAPEAAPVSPVDPLDRRATPGPGAASRAILTADAEAACATAGTHLGDWSVLYGADGTTALVLRFACSPGAATAAHSSP